MVCKRVQSSRGIGKTTEFFRFLWGWGEVDPMMGLVHPIRSIAKAGDSPTAADTDSRHNARLRYSRVITVALGIDSAHPCPATWVFSAASTKSCARLAAH